MSNRGRVENAIKQSKEVHYCSTCDSYGQGQKMWYHMKNCDGTGFQNYWSRVRSDLLKSYAIGFISLDDVYNMLDELKEEARLKNNGWEKVTP